MMGLGKGNSPFKHGNFLVSMLDFKPTTLDTYCLSHHQDCLTFFQFKGCGPQIKHLRIRHPKIKDRPTSLSDTAPKAFGIFQSSSAILNRMALNDGPT